MRILIALIAIVGVANADLMLNITDAGAGQTRWQFSGSATALDSNSGFNSFWGTNWNGGTGNPIVVSSGFGNPIVSGSGSLMTTSGGSFAMSSISAYKDAANQILTGRHTAAVLWDVGDTLSWTGDIVAGVSISTLNPGTYETSQLLGGKSLINSKLIVTIAGQVDPVPEPGTYAMFGLALAGYAIYRRRRAA